MPSTEMHSMERVLDTKECEALPYASKIRQIASGSDGIIMDSEVVSYDDKFGYIFRYEILNFLEDDGSFHPEDGMKGRIYRSKAKKVIFTKDGEAITAVYSPMFELPKPNDL